MHVLTVPNGLSLSRIALALPAAWALIDGRAALTVVLFALVVASDLLDGRIARHRGQVSRLGSLLDHGADAIFVSVLAAAAAWLGLLPPALPVLIAVAFVQYLLDSRPLAGAGLRGSRLGRLNGIAYFVVGGAAVAVHHFTTGDAVRAVLLGAGWLLVASTLASIGVRAVHSLRGTRRS